MNFGFLKNRVYGPAFYLMKRSLKEIARLNFEDLGGIIYYFTGSGSYYNYLHSKYYSEKESCFNFNNIRVPAVHDKRVFVSEFLDLIYPVISNDLDFPFLEGPYEYESVRLNPGDVVFDCGANIGMFSAYASSKGSKVYAFEPIPQIVEYLTITAKHNPNITVCPLALIDEKADIMISIDNKNVGGSSIVIKRNKGEEILVKGTTVDNFVSENNIKRVDFIKADIEGAERKMLLGARDVLKEFAPKLSICKYHLPDDSEILKKIILDANPRYSIMEYKKKIYAICE